MIKDDGDGPRKHVDHALNMEKKAREIPSLAELVVLNNEQSRKNPYRDMKLQGSDPNVLGDHQIPF